MKSFRYLYFAFIVLAAFLTGVLTQKYGVLNMSQTIYLKLKEPLLLNAEGKQENFHMLPAGTPLYKDQTFPEGHTRYIVYINVKGAFSAERIESKKANLIDPIWGYPVQRTDLPDLIGNAPLSKDDLVRILKARKMNREELAQIVREWRDE